MRTLKDIRDRLLSIRSSDFDAMAMELFHYQSENNRVYREFLGHLGIDPNSITQIDEIPFMPVEFFKYHKVICEGMQEKVVYKSSGTTGQAVSSHFVPDPDLYLKHAAKIFQSYYGPLSDYHILALLPGYLEREGSSLIAMIQHFIAAAADKHSGFYLYNHDELRKKVRELTAQSQRKILLFGVSFALLDLAEEGNFPETDRLIVMETGGMKGRKREILREELHEILCEAFGVEVIHSEYGMTEALSQAYSQGHGLFSSPDSMQIRLRDPNDPLDLSNSVKRGAVNLIDLANIHSCAFLQIGDLAERIDHRLIRILGRMDNSDIRGCNLMVQQSF